jgi:hypothetical protein
VQGRVVAPGEPAVGSHTLTVTVENDPVVPDEVQVFTREFFIDASRNGILRLARLRIRSERYWCEL